MIVSFPEWKSDPTKRSILRKFASIHHPLGFVSSVTLGGKCLYPSVCCETLAWDAELTGTLKFKWQRWQQGLPKQIAVRQPLTDHRETVQEIQFHGFDDTSGYKFVSECEGCPTGNACNKT